MHNLQIFVALDCSSELDAKKITNKLDPEYCGIKVGKELFTAVGPKIIDYIPNFIEKLKIANTLFFWHFAPEIRIQIKKRNINNEYNKFNYS